MKNSPVRYKEAEKTEEIGGTPQEAHPGSVGFKGLANRATASGHTPASCAAAALDDILGTEETRIKVSKTMRRMQDGAPDMDRLRRLAEERYRQSSDRRDE